MSSKNSRKSVRLCTNRTNTANALHDSAYRAQIVTSFLAASSHGLTTTGERFSLGSCAGFAACSTNVEKGRKHKTLLRFDDGDAGWRARRFVDEEELRAVGDRHGVGTNVAGAEPVGIVDQNPGDTHGREREQTWSGGSARELAPSYTACARDAEYADPIIDRRVVGIVFVSEEIVPCQSRGGDNRTGSRLEQPRAGDGCGIGTADECVNRLC